MAFTHTLEQRRFSAEKLQKLNLFETEQMFCDVYCLEPGQAQKPHAHEGATKFYYVIEGEGSFTSGETVETLGPGGLAWSGPGPGPESDLGHARTLARARPGPCQALSWPGPWPGLQDRRSSRS